MCKGPEAAKSLERPVNQDRLAGLGQEGGPAWSYPSLGPRRGTERPVTARDVSRATAGFLSLGRTGSSDPLSLLFCVPSAYTEPYKVCPISTAAPKEDLTSDEEHGSSEEEEDSAARDPSLTHKVGGGPVGCRGQRCEGGGDVHSLPSRGGGSSLQTAEPWLDAEAESHSGLLPEDTRQTGPRDAAG